MARKIKVRPRIRLTHPAIMSIRKIGSWYLRKYSNQDAISVTVAMVKYSELSFLLFKVSPFGQPANIIFRSHVVREFEDNTCSEKKVADRFLSFTILLRILNQGKQDHYYLYLWLIYLRFFFAKVVRFVCLEIK